MLHPLDAEVCAARSILRRIVPVCLGILGGLAASPSHAQVVPLLDQVRNDPFTANTTASFGYTNSGATTTNIGLGPNNFFTPGPSFRGQPTSFLPGTSHNVFSTTFVSSSSAQWTLNGTSASALAENGLTETYVQSSGNSTPPTLTLFNGSTLRQQGGTFSTGTATIRNGTTLSVEGGVFSASALNNSGTTTLATGSLNVPSINNSGIFALTGGTATATTFTNNGGLRITGGTLAITDLIGTGPFDWRGGTIELASANLVTGGTGFLGSNPNLAPGATLRLVTGTTNVGLGQFVNISPTATLITQGGNNAGTLYVSGTLTSGAKFTNTNGAVINASAATLSFTGDGIANTTDGLQNLGELNVINATISGDVRSPAGSEVNAAGGVTFTGMFSGAGNFTGGGLATFLGGYSPGDSPALVTHKGSLAFGSTNVLTMEISALTRGAEYDALVVEDTLTFGGTLKLAVLNGFSPQLGQTFDLFDWDNANGAFSNFDLPSLNPGLAWDVSSLYSNGEIRVAAVPEPSACALFSSIAAVGLAVWRPRYRR